MGLTGCALLNDRRQFAAKAATGAAPVTKEYRTYVSKDTGLSDSEKKMRNRLADELDTYLQEGSK
jgi:hypothetical protein